MQCLPVYDFGSTTELLIKVQSYWEGIWKKEPVTILSRNEPPEILCCKCGKNPAQWVDAAGYYEEDAFWCEECLGARRTEEWEDDRLNEEVINEKGDNTWRIYIHL